MVTASSIISFPSCRLWRCLFRSKRGNIPLKWGNLFGLPHSTVFAQIISSGGSSVGRTCVVGADR